MPPGPAIVVANEFFDALPVRHYVKTPTGWHQRLVGLQGGTLAFGLSPEPEPAIRVAAPEGAVLEVGLVAQGLAKGLAARLVREGGAALVIDYGYARPAFAETLQAVKRHGFVDPLAEPGEAGPVGAGGLPAACAAPPRPPAPPCTGPCRRGASCARSAFAERAAALTARASPDQAAGIAAALDRLTGAGTPERPGMGEIFKALAITAPTLPAPPGFEDALP